jgi:hypothetical protein
VAGSVLTDISCRVRVGAGVALHNGNDWESGWLRSPVQLGGEEATDSEG